MGFNLFRALFLTVSLICAVLLKAQEPQVKFSSDYSFLANLMPETSEVQSAQPRRNRIKYNIPNSPVALEQGIVVDTKKKSKEIMLNVHEADFQEKKLLKGDSRDKESVSYLATKAADEESLSKEKPTGEVKAEVKKYPEGIVPDIDVMPVNDAYGFIFIVVSAYSGFIFFRIKKRHSQSLCQKKE
ncbi:hypothetical protein D0T49_02575 [Paludibacter sp. 221]|uniref:hypothetical protein n=1 Tax=Paludibacter sp. 221 TaxID=2302939 RepID=UPI0013D44BCA|nr:hypothetical protein [Paludibacter sp. 221]NDV45931.1 hypothetical protein [Paludibacter sp. 221]